MAKMITDKEYYEDLTYLRLVVYTTFAVSLINLFVIMFFSMMVLSDGELRIKSKTFLILDKE